MKALSVGFLGLGKSSLYRLLKSQNLTISPAYITIKAANEFRYNTIVPNHMWQQVLPKRMGAVRMILAKP
jgi:hypothetical protein